MTRERSPTWPLTFGALLALGLAVLPLGCSFLLSGDYTGESSPTGTGTPGADAGSPGADGSGSLGSDGGGGDAPKGYAATVLSDAPVGYWPLDERSGTTAVDGSGHGRDLRIVGPAVLGQPGIGGRTAFGFTSDVTLDIASPMSASFDLSANKPYSIEAWVRSTGTGSAYRRVFSKIVISGPGPTDGAYLTINYEASSVYFSRWNGGSSTDDVSLATRLPSDRFVHLVVVMDGTRGRIYVDGVEVRVGTPVSDPPPDPSVPLVWGGFFVGDLDELAFYDKALPAERVKAHWSAANRQ